MAITLMKSKLDGAVPSTASASPPQDLLTGSIQKGNTGRECEASARVVRQLIAIGQEFYSRNWVLGTSGNFSAIVSRDPFQLVITAARAHKGSLAARDLLQVDQYGTSPDGSEKPSGEMPIHWAIISQRGAGAILHTHSVWATILSDIHAASRGLALEGFEMLKGLSQVKTHQHREWLPILENSQDYAELSKRVALVLRDKPEVHGVLLRRHGLYTWGKDIDEAKRHVEIFEFLFEVLGRQLCLPTKN